MQRQSGFKIKGDIVKRMLLIQFPKLIYPMNIPSRKAMHKTIFPKIITLLEDKGASNILVFGDGTVPKKD